MLKMLTFIAKDTILQDGIKEPRDILAPTFCTISSNCKREYELPSKREHAANKRSYVRV